MNTVPLDGYLVWQEKRGWVLRASCRILGRVNCVIMLKTNTNIKEHGMSSKIINETTHSYFSKTATFHVCENIVRHVFEYDKLN